MTPAVRARIGISLFFLTNGALYANMLPRLPEIKASLGLGNAAFGLMVAAWSLGSLCALHLPAVVMRRVGPLRQGLVGTGVIALVIASLGHAPTAWVFAALLFLGGLADAFVDPAQNVHGLRVQRFYGRTIFNSLHALWSCGAATGGVIGALAARAHVPVPVHLGLSAATFLALAVLATYLSRLPSSFPVRDETVHEPGAATGRIPRAAVLALALLVVLSVSGTLVEEIGMSWASLYLVQQAGVAVSAAGVGYVTFIVAQTLGRLAGDPMTDRLGRVATARLGGVLVAAGYLLAVALPVTPAILAGYALAGAGCATIVPAAFAASDEVPGLRHGTGVTVIGWLMRLGFLLTSPAVGALSSHVGLRWALLVPVVAGLVTVALAGASRPAGGR